MRGSIRFVALASGTCLTQTAIFIGADSNGGAAAGLRGAAPRLRPAAARRGVTTSGPSPTIARTISCRLAERIDVAGARAPPETWRSRRILDVGVVASHRRRSRSARGRGRRSRGRRGPAVVAPAGAPRAAPARAAHQRCGGDLEGQLVRDARRRRARQKRTGATATMRSATAPKLHAPLAAAQRLEPTAVLLGRPAREVGAERARQLPLGDRLLAPQPRLLAVGVQRLRQRGPGRGGSATATTSTVQRSSATCTSTVSPGRTSFAGFTRAPFRCTRPPSTASVARPRVLKKRAAQSHLSIRTASTRAVCRIGTGVLPSPLPRAPRLPRLPAARSSRPRYGRRACALRLPDRGRGDLRRRLRRPARPAAATRGTTSSPTSARRPSPPRAATSVLDDLRVGRLHALPLRRQRHDVLYIHLNNDLEREATTTAAAASPGVACAPGLKDGRARRGRSAGSPSSATRATRTGCTRTCTSRCTRAAARQSTRSAT